MSRAIQLTVPEEERRTKAGLIKRWLSHYRVAWLPESDATSRLSRVPYGDEPRPSAGEVLVPEVRRLADEMLGGVEEASTE